MDLFDGHCDTILKCYLEGGGLRRQTGHLDLERRRGKGRWAQFFATFGSPEDMPDRSLWEVFLEEYALFRSEIDANADLVTFCRTGAEAEAAFAAGKTAAFLSAEGAELLDCDLEKLRMAHRMGVRIVNITWNHPNALSGTNAEEPDRGLSEQGRAFVKTMGELGMLVDVSHLSDPGFWDVMEITNRPVVATHSNSRAVFPHPRNLTDEQFTAIINTNGVAGLNMYAGFLGDDPDLDTVVSHLEHFLALGGENNVSMGGDWDGITSMPRGMSGIQDMEKLYEHLLRRNYSEALLEKVFYSNLMRVVNEVCSM
ncbi:dipeptidase [Intestinimonas timonensis]|mgnify:FL=1|uniref:dipeptidase n=1 Tax=Intestinimonas timonensis TaxID=1689270 RepID=UPI0024B15BAD|nr:dipeptidase [Intestinimonas timonensis]